MHLAAMSGFSAGIRTIFAYGFSTIYFREVTEDMLPLDFAVDGYISTIEDVNYANGDAALTQKEMEFRSCIDTLLMSAVYDRPVFTHAESQQRGMSFLPIHGAAAAQPCSVSWKQVVSMYGRDYGGNIDVRGRTAMHVLVSANWKERVPPNVAEMIADTNDLDGTSVTTYDDSGLIPLHAALVHLAPYHVIECLLKCNLGTISMEVDEDCDAVQYRGMLPFQLAAACGCGVDVANLLLRSYPISVAGALPKEKR